MPVTFKKTVAIFEGDCVIEEAESLLEWLQGAHRRKIKLGPCRHMHTALLQLLMAYRPRIATWPTDPELNQWLAPTLGAPGSLRAQPATQQSDHGVR